MRPLKLTMKAFGPYLKPITLDFESNLRDKNIFLIHGATGAGKTTILDAICYALYGRASGNDREGAMMRSKGISEDVKMEVEFAFALGEKIYKVRRELSYHPNRKNPVQIKAELSCGAEMLETKSTAVTNRIKDLLGFNAEQFRQVVLLPQGEFGNFLKAKADERQPVLNALFNAEFYEKVESGLKVKADAAQKISDELKSKKEALETQLQGAKLDDAAIEKLRADLVAAREKAAALEKIFKDAQEKFTAGKILAGDFDELKRRSESLIAAKNNLDQAEKIFTDTKIEYDKREGEQSKRDELKSAVDKLAEIKKSLAELDAKQKALDEAEKNLQTATTALKNVVGDAEKFDRRLAELKAQRSDLAGAEKNFAEAKTILDKADDREKILQEIARLETDLKRAGKKISDAEKKYSAANLDLARLQRLQRDGSAALLAKNLRDGEPCPVCGSRVHYPVDFGDAIIPSDKEIDAAQTQADKFKKIFDDAKISAAEFATAIATQRDGLKKFSDVPDKATAQKKFDEAKTDVAKLADCEKRIALGEKYISENKSKLDEANQKQQAAANVKARCLGELQAIQKQIPENYLANPAQLDADIVTTIKKMRELENAWKTADKKFRAASEKKSACDGAFTTAQKSKDELADKLKDETPPDVDALKIRAETAQKNHAAAIREENSLDNDLKRLEKLSAQIVDLNEKIAAAEKNLRIWRRLSDAANGKVKGNKLSFTRYYLSFMFDQVLTEANYRLEKMSDRRYALQKKYEGKSDNSTAGLNLEIFDEYTGESRPVATLSGGESFLASLSLALGLAAVVRNNLGGVKLDTIFIDEGFGSLDSETLDFAISTINELSGGRLVGIISHVEELKNQMPVRLEVFKTKTGSVAKFSC